MKKGNWPKWFIIVLVFYLPLGIMGCSDYLPLPTEIPTPSPTDTPTPTPGDTGINFTLPDLDGKEVTLFEFRGKPVLVFFFKSYCTYCSGEAPGIQKIYLRHQGELQILGIAVNEDRDTGNLIDSPEEYAQTIRSNFVNRYGLTFPVLIDNYGKEHKKYIGSGVPAFLFLNEKGEIQYVEKSAISESELESLLYRYLL